MNRDQVKGAAKDTTGKIQRKVGELTGNQNQKAKDTANQVEGKIQKGVGNVEQALDRADKESRAKRTRTVGVVKVDRSEISRSSEPVARREPRRGDGQTCDEVGDTAWHPHYE